METDLGSFGLHKPTEYLFQTALGKDAGKLAHHQLRWFGKDHVTKGLLSSLICLCINNRARILGWELVN